MNRLLKSRNLPLFAVVAGIIGSNLRKQYEIWALDDRGLLTTNHPLQWLLWLVVAAALAVIGVSVWRLKGSDRYEDNFAPSKGAAAGHFCFAAGIGLTVLLQQPLMGGYLGQGWRLLGLLSVPCLTAAGLARWQGKKPFFALHMVPSLFLVLHIINHYQLWSGNPQTHDYVFVLFGTMALLLFAYYTAAFDVDHGSRRMHLATGLGALCLCLVAQKGLAELPMYGGGLFWVLSDLCSLTPQPREEEGENADDPS